MSTDLQDHSIANQTAAIARYAAEHRAQIVRTYADEGRSGLDLAGRPGLTKLLQDVQSGMADFEILLVHDVSRWGRFQDPDESAYYEYICRKAKIQVEYCGELFSNDGSAFSTIVKNLKRAMAAEYSRELSAKVSDGHRRLFLDGFHQGGAAGFGLRRLAVDAAGNPRFILNDGEQKSIKTDRIILIPGPRSEVQVIQEIFQRFVGGATAVGIAADLNARKIPNKLDRKWTAEGVLRLLRNERYAGTNVYGKSQGKLRSRRVRIPTSHWIKAPGAIEALVSPELFRAAQRRLRVVRKFSDEEMRGLLKGLLAKHGYLTSRIINGTAGMPSASLYKLRFGSLVEAYASAGYQPRRSSIHVDKNRRMRATAGVLAAELGVALRERGFSKVSCRNSRIVADGIVIDLFVKRAVIKKSHAVWDVSLSRASCDAAVIAKFAEDGETLVDVHLVSFDVFPKSRITFGYDNGGFWDDFKFLDLNSLAACLATRMQWH